MFVRRSDRRRFVELPRFSYVISMTALGQAVLIICGLLIMVFQIGRSNGIEIGKDAMVDEIIAFNDETGAFVAREQASTVAILALRMAQNPQCMVTNRESGIVVANDVVSFSGIDWSPTSSSTRRISCRFVSPRPPSISSAFSRSSAPSAVRPPCSPTDTCCQLSSFLA